MYYWMCMKEKINYFVKTCINCQVNRAFYQKQVAFYNCWLSRLGHGLVCTWHSMSIELITSLPKLQGQYAILVMED